MRIWSVHPKHLDTKGLVALWRESLLAKHVLLGKTRGYKQHPQLERFKKSQYPVDAVNCYLHHVYLEASERGYNFSIDKIELEYSSFQIPVTDGQLKFEIRHLKNKLRDRDIPTLKKLNEANQIDLHPMFNLVEGKIECWEKINPERNYKHQCHLCPLPSI